MFNVTLSGVVFQLEGCPETGLGAVDWRRRHGLPTGDTDRLRVEGGFEVSVTDESLCRALIAAWPDGARRSADFSIDFTKDMFGAPLGDRVPVSADLATRLLVSPPEEGAWCEAVRRWREVVADRHEATIVEALALPDDRWVQWGNGGYVARPPYIIRGSKDARVLARMGKVQAGLDERDAAQQAKSRALDKARELLADELEALKAKADAAAADVKTLRDFLLTIPEDARRGAVRACVDRQAAQADIEFVDRLNEAAGTEILPVRDDNEEE